MSDTSDKVCCVVDHGLFMELALRLSRDFKKVYYYTPWEKGFPLVNDCVVGDGFGDIVRIDGFWDLLDEINCFVFPDIQHGCLQRHLALHGKSVWGSRHGDSLELKRAHFKEVLEAFNLPVGPWKSIIGLPDLRDYLRENENKFVKISKYRGCMESWHHINYELSEPTLDHLAVVFGLTQDAIPFIVEDPIETDIEVGYDGYCVDGEFPQIGLQGYETKDRGLIASVQHYADIPDEVTSVNKALSPILGDFNYRNFFSTEIRVKDGKSYFIDPCCRCPSPCIEIQMELWENLGEIIFNGGLGKLVDPVPKAKFGAVAMIDHKKDCKEWRTLEIPDAIRQWVKLYFACKHNGLYGIPPFPHSCDTIGAVIGIGNTIQEAIDHLKSNADQLDSDYLDVHTDALYEGLQSIQEAEKKGIEFTDQPVPKPETVLQ